MNEQEAINTLWGKPYVVPVKDYETAKNMAIKSLEMQMPKKVIYDEYGKEEGYPFCECGQCLIDDLVGLNYCPNCGQKLDWE